MSEVAELIAYLTPSERVELDTHLVALAPVVPHSEYQRDPVRWAVDKLGIPEHTIRWSHNGGYARHEWDGTPDPLAAMADSLVAWRNVGCESGTTTGKSFFVAILILWFLACHEDARVFTFAPKEDQLKLFIWMEIRKLWLRFSAHFPTATLHDLTLRMRGGQDEGWAAHGYAVGVGANEQSATRAQGMHAQHMLLVYEETPGIPQAVLEAGANTSTAPHNLRLAIGNPVSQQDALHVFCGKPRTDHIRISALDHPNVVTGNPDLIPGAVSQQSIDDRREEYGETDPMFLSRVRGISPEQAANALIRLEWLKASAARWAARAMVSPGLSQFARFSKGFPPVPSAEVSENTGLYTDELVIERETRSANQTQVEHYRAIKAPAVRPIALKVTGKGVDVANSEHGDPASVCDFSGNAVVRLVTFSCPDGNALGRQVKLEMDADGLDPNRVGIDGIGVGAGTVNELRRLRAPVRDLQSGGAAIPMVELLPDGKRYEWTGDVNRFNNLRSQIQWQLREDFRKGVIDVPGRIGCPLWEELTAGTFTDFPKIAVEPKKEVRARLGRSTNELDSLTYANWVRARAFVAPVVEQQQGKSLGWSAKTGKPVERETGQQAFDRMIQKAQGNPRSGRMRVPRAKP